MTALKIIQKLFEARDQIHLIHLNTTSYSEHKALDNFYKSWLDLVDIFIETYQGKYGRIEGNLTFDISVKFESRAYLISLMSFLNSDIESIISIGIDTDLENIVADMKGLVNQTLYLLTLK